MAMNEMMVKLQTLWPEMTLLIGAVACLATGLSGVWWVRKSTAVVAGVAIGVAQLFATGVIGPGLEVASEGDGHPLGLDAAVVYLKVAALAVGLVLLLVAARTPEHLKQVVTAESKAAFEPGDDFRGEFFAFFLFSLTGVLLTAGATDLVWLFLALELTSLPTYILVATGRDKAWAQESAVKYFFLGAMAAAVFLFGFALIYAASGFTTYAGIHAYVVDRAGADGGLPPLMLVGMVLAVVGVGFKIAAVPMHFYTADVYEGAAVPVTAMLAFVPKAAGFAALIGLLSLVGWRYGPDGDRLPLVLEVLIAVMAVATMTVGNVLGLMQSRVKRVLAYSSVAHSGYMLVGLLAGSSVGGGGLGNGVSAIAFYLVAYGLGTIASFAVLGCLHGPEGDEAATYDDLSGLRHRHPFLAGTLLVACLSLLGFPFTVGFIGKINLSAAGFVSGHGLVVIALVLNSAISAAYYLRIGSVCFFGKDYGTTEARYVPVRITGAIIASVMSIGLGLQGGWLESRALEAGVVAERETGSDEEAAQKAAPSAGFGGGVDGGEAVDGESRGVVSAGTLGDP
ncbi:MAG: NADH-quinone oxidoreductase subunit N [Planctomycetota bacterium]